MKKSSYIVKASLIAAIYVIITGLFAPISFGHGIFQLRISEALTVLPIYTSAAIPGLFVGCMMSNLIFGGLGIIDLIFGSLATLIASYLTYKLKNKGKIIALIPPVVVNALIVGTYLKILLFKDVNVLVTIGYTFLGQLGACYIIGMMFSMALDKYKDKLK
ncbi:MAG: QueT transporter family protein [Ruminococcaceae bacterium]|nr:QueT transporter family protein [Oscillospiraceae bacterium]